MITVTNQQIINSVPSLSNLGALKIKPVSLSFKIAGTLRKLQNALKYYEDARIWLVDEYAKQPKTPAAAAVVSWQ